MISLEYLCIATASLIAAIWAGNQVIDVTNELSENQTSSLRESLRKPQSLKKDTKKPNSPNRHTMELYP